MLFTAHSLPVRTLEDGTQRCKTCDCDDSCRYRDGLQATADLVAAQVGLEDHRIAWQSVGRTADPWWGPGIDEVIPQLAAEGRTAVVVCCAGFVADHLETLYDLDIEADRGGRGGGHRVRPHADAQRRPRVLRRAGGRRARTPGGRARVKLVTWNVNSIRQRLPRLLALLERHEPDVVCLQETKVEDGVFPTMEIAAAGL